MKTGISEKKAFRKNKTNKNRSFLLSKIPVRENRYTAAGLSTVVLEGGGGNPVILLHGPGESSLWWMRILPDLIKTNFVIVPDLPGHGASGSDAEATDESFLSAWLEEVIETSCSSAPVLVGHILGGSIAARFSVNHGNRIEKLVLVNSLGLAKFRPSPGFAFGLIRFMIRSTEKNYLRFLHHCMFDSIELQSEMGEDWEPFLNYVLDCAQNQNQKAVLRRMMKQVGIPKIPSQDLAAISVPTELIWGRHDLANKLHIARAASKRYGWPLHIIENTRDDPKLEQPRAFLKTLYTAMNLSHVHKINKPDTR